MSEQNMSEQVEALFAPLSKEEIESTVAGAAEFPISADVAAFLQVQPGDFLAAVGNSMLLMRPQTSGAVVCLGEISRDSECIAAPFAVPVHSLSAANAALRTMEGI
jgi:hypothetical protein